MPPTATLITCEQCINVDPQLLCSHASTVPPCWLTHHSAVSHRTSHGAANALSHGGVQALTRWSGLVPTDTRHRICGR